MSELTKLPNIGKALEKQLNQVGITTYEGIKTKGSKNVWLDILSFDSSACINKLYALEGAIQGINKTLLQSNTKKDLKDFYLKEKRK